jgi:hypothetical protein
MSEKYKIFFATSLKPNHWHEVLGEDLFESKLFQITEQLNEADAFFLDLTNPPDDWVNYIKNKQSPDPEMIIGYLEHPPYPSYPLNQQKEIIEDQIKSVFGMEKSECINVYTEVSRLKTELSRWSRTHNPKSAQPDFSEKIMGQLLEYFYKKT